MRTRRDLLTGLAAGTAALALPWPARAQEDVPQEQGRIHIIVGAPGASKLPLALPRPVGAAGQSAEFYQVVRRDLELSGWFDLIEEAAHIEPGGTGVQPGQFRFEDWEVPGAVALGKTVLTDSGGTLRAEAWVYDVPGRRKLGAKAFTGGAASVRSLAHKVANEIVFRVTGQNAPFATRFAVAGTFSGNKEIYVVDFDGHGLTKITQNGSINLQPAWSPSGSKLAFTSYTSGNPDCYVADLGGGKITRLSARTGINTGPAWSPDGSRLALTMSPSGDPDVYILDSRTGEVMTRLTKSAGIDVSPAFSPDGSRIAFVSDRSGGAQVYIANTDGSGVQRVTYQGGHNTDPVWSPKGDRLAFVARSGVFDVFTVKIDGTGLTRITQGMGDNEDPCWSPDGNYLAFSSTRTGSAHIWMATADGTHQVQLTQGKGGYTNPAWSPILGW
ncbi:Tol-Pal system beta propeller repeat protein TolB [Myxococcota bacterium]|nr:Tol-Pal system beta propeller repeat protein TolB [Myxococcota bacterium]